MKFKYIFLFAISLLLPQKIISQIKFQDYLIGHDLNDAFKVVAADIDNDGDIDIVAATNETGLDGIFWYKNNGYGEFIPQQSIESNIGSVTSLHLSDIDNDGDLDVLSSSWRDAKIVWYENTDGKGVFGTQNIISTTLGGGEIYTGDIDGDGTIDIATGSADRITWFKNEDGNGNFFRQESKSINGAESVIIFDVDNDGDNDIIFATNHNSFTDEMGWYENTDGKGNFTIKHSIVERTNNIFSIDIADINNDGKMDLISASPFRDKIAWYEHLDGKGNFSNEKLIENSLEKPRAIFPADIDNDGDVDLFCTSFDGSYSGALDSRNEFKISWFENLDAKGDFSTEKLITTKVRNAHAIHATDIDNDGDIDLLSASRSQDNIFLHENTDSKGNFDVEKPINEPWTSSSFHIGDIDRNGSIDIVSVTKTQNKIVWYKNEDGLGNYGNQNIISSDTQRTISVYMNDLDNDGDLDIIAGVERDKKLSWYENTDGLGNFSNEKIISTEIIPTKILSYDIDNDGDNDIITISQDNKIIWYQNTNGKGDFDNGKNIIEKTTQIRSIYISDINNDNRLDIIFTSNDQVSWLKNMNELGTFSEEITIGALEHAYAIFTSDIDGDNNKDILVSSTNAEIVWYKNNGNENFDSKVTIVNYNISGFTDINAVDLDDDGDNDLVFCIRADFEKSNIIYFENINGQGMFSEEHIIAPDSADSIYSTDIDNDGDIDLVTSARELSWYRNSTINNNSTLGFNDQQETLPIIKVYPNPVSEKLSIKSKSEVLALKLYNLNGNLILSNSNKKTIDISKLSKGIYFLKIQQNYNKVTTKKIVVE